MRNTVGEERRSPGTRGRRSVWSAMSDRWRARVKADEVRNLNIQPRADLDFIALGALNHRLDPGVIPFRKARSATST